MLFIDRIFTFFSKYDKDTDTHKDINDKGTLERYNELMGDDIDVNLKPFIDNLVQNVLEPKKEISKFVPYSELDMGIDFVIVDTLAYRRAVLSIIVKLYQIKGTLRGYYILFGMLGWTVVITEYFDEFGFDSSITFDDELRRFDSGKCPACTDYSLAITTSSGIPATVDELKSIFAIIKFNEPINAKLRKLSFNNIVISEAADFNSDFNNDFLTN